ncbi:MAG: hypothetical protein ABIQ16_05415 [Polyangiaceae bacterium]
MPRFQYALLGALALHCALLLVHWRHDAGSARQLRERPAEQLIDIDDAPPADRALSAPPESEPSPVGSDATDARSAAPAARTARVEARVASSSQLPSLADAPSSDDSVVAGVATQAQGEAASAEPQRKIDLGLDGHFFLGPPSEMLPRIRKPDARPRPDPQKRLENALAADDVQRGLARGNAFVGSLSAAAREDGPLRGEAMFRVTVGADGGVLSAELVQGAGSDWAAVLSSFRALAAQKRLRVPPGARGLRVTFTVKAKVQRPSGKEVEASPIGVARPSFVKPNGLVPHGDFDLADLGGGGQRLVYARVVSEEVL